MRGAHFACRYSTIKGMSNDSTTPLTTIIRQVFAVACFEAIALICGFITMLNMRMAAFDSFGDPIIFAAMLLVIALPILYLDLLMLRWLCDLCRASAETARRVLWWGGIWAILLGLGSVLLIVAMQPFSMSQGSDITTLLGWVAASAAIAWPLSKMFMRLRPAGVAALCLLAFLSAPVSAVLFYPSAPAAPSTEITRITRDSESVFVIGLDGATFDVIDPMIEAGQLPNIKALLARGSRANLMSEMAPNQPFADSASQGMRTPVIWETIITGEKPRNHQIWDFYQTNLPALSKPIPFRLPFPGIIGNLLNAQDKAVYSTDARRQRAWEIVGATGADTLVVGWVDSWPAFGDNHCAMISDRAHFDTRGTTHPTDYEFDYSWYYRDYPLIAKEKFGEQFYPDFKTEFIDEPEMLLQQTELFDKLIVGSERDDWYREGLYTELAKDVFNFKLNTDYAEMFGKENHIYWENHLVVNEIADIARDNFYADSAVSLLQQRRANKEGLPALSCFYFPSTDTAQHWLWKYYEPSAFENVNASSVKRLGDAIPAVYRNADRIVGQLLAEADADTTVIIVSDHGGGSWQEQGDGSAHEGYSGNHRPNGIFIAAGPGIRQGYVADDMNIYDVAPFVMHVSGMPIADVFHPLSKEVLTTESLTIHPPTSINSYGPRVIPDEIREQMKNAAAGDQMYLDRLAELGYAEQSNE
jgi:hypothetical protein